MKLSNILRGSGTLAALVLLAACAGEYPQSSIDPKTDFAQVIHDLYGLVTWFTLVILIVTWGLLAYVLVRFREKPDSGTPKQIHGHLGLEVAWTIVPALIVVAIAVPTVRAVFATQRPADEGAMVVEVVGHQFWWEFRYPDGVVTANELHLPVDRPVSLQLHSLDVIHSFWVPMLGGKRDVNPLRAVPEGDEQRYNWLHFTPNEVGEYMGQCAEFCGPSHSLMGLRVVVESQADFDAWRAEWQEGHALPAPAAELAEGLDAETVVQGRELVMNSTCLACHAIRGTPAQGRVGPNLTLLGRRSTLAAGWLDNSVESLVRWITAPQDVKPGVKMPGVDAPGGNFPPTGYTPEQVQAIAQYLYSLR